MREVFLLCPMDNHGKFLTEDLVGSSNICDENDTVQCPKIYKGLSANDKYHIHDSYLSGDCCSDDAALLLASYFRPTCEPQALRRIDQWASGRLSCSGASPCCIRLPHRWLMTLQQLTLEIEDNDPAIQSNPTTVKRRLRA